MRRPYTSRPTIARCALPGAVLVLAIAACGSAAAMDPEGNAACRNDLDALPEFLLENDSGARDHVARKGQAVFDAALVRARRDAAAANSDADCRDVLRSYLRTYRAGHLGLSNLAEAPATATPATGADANAPSFEVLSPTTALLVLPSFDPRHEEAMAGLLKRQAKAIDARPNLIIDVRRNGGGSDATFASVLPLIEANLRSDVGAEFLATPANIESSQQSCEVFAPTSQSCLAFMRSVIEAMQAATPGTFVLPIGQDRIETIRPASVRRHPRRVAVMIDHACGSSCEEFVLAVRQSFKVKLFGRPTYGSLDYSNLRPHTLPSGRRRLIYATSRSLRLPAYTVDVTGIAPDQVLPAPTDEQAARAEIVYVREVLESAR